MRTAAIACLLLAPLALWAEPPKGGAKKSDGVVKVTAAAGKIENGKQMVKLTFKVDDGWHVYGNPVGVADFESARTQVTVNQGGKAVKADVTFPKAKQKPDAAFGTFNIHEGEFVVDVSVPRAAGDAALEVTIKLQSCDKGSCLPPGTIKVNVQ